MGIKEESVEEFYQKFANHDRFKPPTDTEITVSESGDYTMVEVTELSGKREAKFGYLNHNLVVAYFSGHKGGSWSSEFKTVKGKYLDGNKQERNGLNLGTNGEVQGVEIEDGKVFIQHKYKKGKWVREREWEFIPRESG